MDLITGYAKNIRFWGDQPPPYMKRFYNATDKDIAIPRSALGALNSDAAADTAPLKAHIARNVDQEIIDAIAREFRKGRRLFVGTTNLDALRPVIWNIGDIAASGRPDAGDLIRTIMLASASIPPAFPPQYIPVVAGGKRYDEIHVDGGAIVQAFLYPYTCRNCRIIRFRQGIKRVEKKNSTHNNPGGRKNENPEHHQQT